MDQRLSKDMKKQSHVTSRKPRNKKLSSDKSLAQSPKKGRFTEPNSKKLDAEKFLSKSKLTHIKEFNEFGTKKFRIGDILALEDWDYDYAVVVDIKGDMISIQNSDSEGNAIGRDMWNTQTWNISEFDSVEVVGRTTNFN